MGREAINLQVDLNCSGIYSICLRNLHGVSIPRVASAQYSASSRVSNPKAGRLVFFSLGVLLWIMVGL